MSFKKESKVREAHLLDIQRKQKPIISCSLAIDYFKSRKIDLNTISDIEDYFVFQNAHNRVTICANLDYKENGDLNSVHRTIVTQESTHSFKKTKLFLGEVSPTGFPLFSKDHQPTEIVVCEGLEDGLSIKQSTNRDVICILSSTLFNKFNPPNYVEKIIIAADLDKSGTGLKAAQKLEKRLTLEGFICTTILPPRYKPGEKSLDWNTVLMDQGEEETNEFFIESLEDANLKSSLSKGNNNENIKTYFEVAQKIRRTLYEQTKMDDLIIYDSNAGIFQAKQSPDDMPYRRLVPREFYERILSFMIKNNIAKNKVSEQSIKNIAFILRDFYKTNTKFPSIRNYPNLDCKNLIFAKNGVFKIETDSIERIEVPNSDVYTLFQLNAALKFDVSTPIWNQFLDDFTSKDLSLKLALQEIAGYFLNEDYSFHIFPVIFGYGRNGKGVFAAMLAALIGKENISNLSLGYLSDRFGPAGLSGKLLNITNEGNFSRGIDEDKFKELTAGGTTRFENKHKDSYDFQNKAKFIVFTNEKPLFKDSSDAIYARMFLLFIKFQVLDTTKQNADLSNPEFWMKSGELPGILEWAVKGRQRLYKNKGFTTPSSTIELTNQVKEDSNPVKTFLKTYFEESSSDSRISTKEIFESYVEYCLNEGIKAVSMQKLSSKIPTIFPNAERSENLYYRQKRCRGWIHLKKKSFI